jgi:predicted ribosome quality control (RQC) complex YloA/Tae2 family protein
VIIAERPDFAEGHLRHEWVIRLTGKRSEAALFFSLRPRHPYLALSLSKGPKASIKATHSPFSLSLSKQLRGAKILGLEALERERILVLWFDHLGLVLCMIPAVPEALLVRVDRKQATGPIAWPILSRSRTLKAPQPIFTPPSGAQAPEAPVVRSELFASPEAFFKTIEKELKAEAFESRLQGAVKALKEIVKLSRDRIRQSGTALKEAEREADWQHYGELLKSSMHELPPPGPKGERVLTDYESGEPVTIPGDPQLTPAAQIEKFFGMARRKTRRAEEARLRIETFTENLGRWERALSQLPAPGDWPALEKLERLARIKPGGRAENKSEASGTKSKVSGKGKSSTWLGKSFTSRDGLTILAGRSKDENLELTFKHARGNDVWLHVRGRPGAHVLVPLSPGKSAPLETLLDAATLAIYYSGGEKWGKTEVDYTHKKYVKRIKDSTEASYTGNKTLLVEPDPERIKRLMASQD